MLWTRKGGFIIFFGIFCLFFGLLTDDFQFIVLSLFIFTFFMLVLVMPRPRVSLKRKISNPVMFENNELKVHLKISRDQVGYGNVEVYDRIPEYSELKDGINNMIYNPTAKSNLNYRVKFPLRGYYSIGPTKVRISDHFNYFYKDHTLLEKQPISVFLRVPGLKEFKFKSKRDIHFPGELLTRRPGASTEFLNIRDYIKGDPFKKINWKVYARKRELMVNEYEKENICDTVLFVDARSISNIGSVLDNSLETSIKLATGIANFLILNRNQIGVVVYSDSVKVLPPKPGLRQRDEIIRFLTGVYPRGWTEFNVALYYARPYIKSKTTIIIISNLEFDNSFIKSVQELASLNHRIMIISPSAIDYEIRTAEFPGPFEKVNFMKEYRQNYLTKLRGFGVDLVECTPEDSIENIVHNVSKEILR